MEGPAAYTPAASGRKASVAGSIMGAAGAARRMLVPDFEFSLGAAKAKVLKAGLEGAAGLPAAFMPFFNGPLYDRLITTLILYFAALLQHEALARCLERARAAHAPEACSPALLAGRMQELADEAAAQRAALSAPYCETILKHSSSRNQQQDRQFFEALYASLATVLAEAFDRLGRQAAIEQELGRLFRGKHFNLAARKHGPQRSVDTLTVLQLWQVKHETQNRALHAQLISSLAEKGPTLSVQVASVSNSPLVSQAISSPAVTCSLLADPAERDTLLALPYSRSSAADKGGAGAARGSRARSAAAGGAAGSSDPFALLGSPTPQAGRAPVPAAQPLVTPRTAAAAASSVTPTAAACGGPAAAAAAAAAAAGSPVPQGPRASAMRPFMGAVAALPEAAGLPYDEGYAYLCLLRRSVLYGPTLGLAAGAAGAQGGAAAARAGGAMAASMTGALSACSSAVWSRAG